MVSERDLGLADGRRCRSQVPVPGASAAAWGGLCGPRRPAGRAVKPVLVPAGRAVKPVLAPAGRPVKPVLVPAGRAVKPVLAPAGRPVKLAGRR